MIPSFCIVPYFYFLNTRLKGIFQKVSWLCVYFVPLLWLFLSFSHPVDGASVIVFLLGVVILNYVYENGYIENDVKTIRLEKEPTLRLESAVLTRMGERYAVIVAIRWGILAVLLAAYLYMVCTNAFLRRPLGLVAEVIILQGCYSLYNRIRGRGNLWFIPIMAFVRFYGALVPFVDNSDLMLFVCLGMFLYPIPKVMEFLRRKRYGFDRIGAWIGNIDYFRVKYYLAYSLTLTGAYLLTRNHVYKIYLIAGIYYLVFRAAGLLALRQRKIGAEFNDNFGRE